MVDNDVRAIVHWLAFVLNTGQNNALFVLSPDWIEQLLCPISASLPIHKRYRYKPALIRIESKARWQKFLKHIGINGALDGNKLCHILPRWWWRNTGLSIEGKWPHERFSCCCLGHDLISDFII
ncbi:hypothetical protein D3C72_1623660 [compost metagenome]